MNPFEFVLLLVGLVLVFQLVKHRLGVPDAKSRGGRAVPFHQSDETQRLQDEVRQLKERLAVLERITVEKENSLAREIEDLRSK